MFDNVEIKVCSGRGGDGSASFRREKFVPLGGPDGGDGGEGGSIVLRTTQSVSNLSAFRQKKRYCAAVGGNGLGRKKHGKNGDDLILEVPPGTVVKNKVWVGDEPEVIADLEEPGQDFVVTGGGKGGKGNIHFASSTNQSPKIAQKGEPGEEKEIALELKTIADVGIIGYPNAGKSSLLAAASAAKPKIAGYPFTTIKPALGAVEIGSYGFILAEVPGLIKDAHLGRGLGHDFLRHVARTKVLIHLVDGSPDSPVEDFNNVNNELNLFDPALAGKKQVVAVNKIDLQKKKKKADTIKEEFDAAGYKAFFISAATGEGVRPLMSHILKVLEQASAKKEETAVRKVFHPKPKDAGIIIIKEDGGYLVCESGLQRVVAASDTNDAEVKRQLLGYFTRRGVDKALKKAGARPGDTVIIDKLKWQW